MGLLRGNRVHHSRVIYMRGTGSSRAPYVHPYYNRGAGIGSVLSGLVRSFFPVVSKVARRAVSSNLGRQVMKGVRQSAVKAGLNMVSDVLSGQNMKVSGKRRVKEAARNVGRTTARAIARQLAPGRPVTTAMQKKTRRKIPKRFTSVKGRAFGSGLRKMLLLKVLKGTRKSPKGKLTAAKLAKLRGYLKRLRPGRASRGRRKGVRRRKGRGGGGGRKARGRGGRARASARGAGRKRKGRKKKLIGRKTKTKAKRRSRPRKQTQPFLRHGRSGAKNKRGGGRKRTQAVPLASKKQRDLFSQMF